MDSFRETLHHATLRSAPLKSILQSFEIYNKKGFNEDYVADTLLSLGNTFHQKVSINPSYQDFEQHELFQNWRFQDLIGDIKYGLRQD